VYSIERLAPLLGKARARLNELRINNVQLRHGDGWLGWRSQRPYDGIRRERSTRARACGAAEQLADGGRLVFPVGLAGAQELLCIRRAAPSSYARRLDLVSFVSAARGDRLR
jgi:protein-L-isoaspartate(D-aspartate) O-methyltransferase